jgi:type I restriction enzyme, S subunit
VIQRLGQLVDQVTTASGDGQVPFVALENIGSRTGSLLPDTELPLRNPESTGMTAFRKGDVVFGKLRPYLAKSWRADRQGICSTELIVMRPRPKVDDRWLAYLAQSDLLVEWAVATSEGVKMPRTSWEKLRLLEVDAPTLPEQRVIADFLDAETTRIDVLLKRAEQLRRLAQERVWARFLDRMISTKAPRVPLRRALLSISDGPFGSAFTSSDYSDEGAFVVRLGNIGLAEFHREPEARIPMILYATFLRHHIRTGDLLIAGLGDEGRHAGRACVAPNLGPAMVKGKCFCARVDEGLADPRYLALYLSSSFGAQELALVSHGSGRVMINLEIAKAVPTVLPELALQVEIAEQTAADQDRADRVDALLGRQIALLIERRLALITAAVTGQLEITRVAA